MVDANDKKADRNCKGKVTENRGSFFPPDFFPEALKSRSLMDNARSKLMQASDPDGRPDCLESRGGDRSDRAGLSTYGWALPGGFVDPGESCEEAAVREGQEELSIRVNLEGQLGTYSDPGRDPRMHTLSVVFMARPAETEALEGADDARRAAWFSKEEIPWNALCFDHGQILRDYWTRMEELFPMRR